MRPSTAANAAAATQSRPGSANDIQADTHGDTLLYHQTIIPTQIITHAIEGSFTLPNAHDIILVRHNVLELWTLHVASNVLELVHSMPLFAAVYAVVAVPTSKAVMLSREARAGGAGGGAAAGQSVLDSSASNVRRDSLHYVAISSETGYVTLMRYVLYEPPMPARVSFPVGDESTTASQQSCNNANSNNNSSVDTLTSTTTMLVTTSLRGRFLKINEVCLGRSGARLTVPGARMAVDVGGEALFVAALMRNKAMVPLRRTALMNYSGNMSENNHNNDRGLSWDGVHYNTLTRRRRSRRPHALRSQANNISDSTGNRNDNDNNLDNYEDGDEDEDDYYYRVMRAGIDDDNDVDDSNSSNDNSDNDAGEGYDNYSNAEQGRNRHRGGGLLSQKTDLEEDSTDAMGDTGSRVRARHAAEQRHPRGVLLLGSPLEMIRQTVTFSLCALDGVLEHVAFAAVEEDIVEATNSESSLAFAHTASSASAAASGSAATTSNANSEATGSAGDAFIKLAQTTAAERAVKEHTRYLVVYAYVRSLQQVQRTHLIHLPPTAHNVIGVPAAPCGPGGVLVCTDTEVIWYDLSGQSQQQTLSALSTTATVAGVFKCAVSLPRRVDFAHTLYDPSIIASTVTCVANDFFMLLQDEHGDVFRVMLSTGDVQKAYTALRIQQQQLQQQQLEGQKQGEHKDSKSRQHSNSSSSSAGGAAAAEPVRRVPNPLRVHYFDTLPAASAMALFRKGFLFVGAEAGPVHGLYKITRNGYMKESEYIVKRVKRARHGEQKHHDHASTANEVNSADRGGSSNHNKNNITDVVKTEESRDAMPAPGALMRPPASRQAKTTTAHATASTGASVRVIAMYQPHTQLRHMALIQSYANTPAITALNTSIPGQDTHRSGASASHRDSASLKRHNSSLDVDEDEEYDSEQQKQQQHQVQINALVGRGVDSVLLLARYGFATVREARFTLHTAFQTVIPLVSATALQSLLRDQRAAILAATHCHAHTAQYVGGVVNSDTNSTNSHSSPTSTSAAALERIRALRQLAATVSSDVVWTDKLILCTAHGSTAFHVGSNLVADTVSGFVTTERTLAAATLRDGCGYVQVTTRAVYVLGAASMLTTTALIHAADAHRSHLTSSTGSTNMSNTHNELSNTTSSINSNADSSRSAIHGVNNVHLLNDPSAVEDDTQKEEENEFAVLSVQPTSWTHPHGKPILAAAVTPTLILLSLGSGGGLVSFDYGLAGTTLQQCDMAPTFPPAPALSLLQPPASILTRAAHGELSALLFHNSSLGRRVEDEVVELAAVATIRQEVFIVHPRKLREPLATIARTTGSVGKGGAITSVLLTYLGTHASSYSSGNNHSSDGNSSVRRLFCLVGYLDGTLLRCELDCHTFRELHSTELSCGAGPCLLVAGDHESVCYVHAAQQSWRCELREGVMKVVPWRFTTRPTMFARFVAPTAEEQQQLLLRQSPGSSSAAMRRSSAETGTMDASVMINLRAQGQQQKRAEMVVAVRERELAIYSSVHSNTSSATSNNVSSSSHTLSTLAAPLAEGVGRSSSSSLEYSFDYHSLRIAGRRLLRHPTRPAYHIIIGTVHRGHTMAEITPPSKSASSVTQRASASSSSSSLLTRSVGRIDHYTSTVQLFHEESSHVFPAYYFPDGEAVLAATMGSFYADFGKEPVLIVASMSRFSHGAGCGMAARGAQGWLRTFRCTTTPSAAAGAGGSALRLEPMHNTLLMRHKNSNNNNNDELSGAKSDSSGMNDASADYASALHVCEDVGLLFVGMSAREGLCVYSWGQQHLLRKRQLPHTASRIVAIDTLFAPPQMHASSTSTSSSSYVADLYRCPPHSTDALRRARQQPLLIVCATLAHSVFVAHMHPGSAENPSYLLQIARDRVPRRVTAMALLDNNTIAVADRSGMVSFLRLPVYPTRTVYGSSSSTATGGLPNSASSTHGSVTTTATKILQPCIRLGFAQPIDQLYDAELQAEQDYLARQQLLGEVASWHIGSVVTALSVQAHDPSHGKDLTLATRMLLYGTALGSVGAFIPFVSEADGVWGWYAQRALAPHVCVALLSQSGRRAYHARGGGGSLGAGGTSDGVSHHVIDGDVFQLWRQSSRAVFTRRSRVQIEEELDRVRRVDGARRRVLGLPVRQMPSLEELISKQRALLTLPQ